MSRSTDLLGTIRVAIKRSRVDGRLRFIVGTAMGYHVTLRDVPMQARYCTNGESLSFVDSGLRLQDGEERPQMMADVDRTLEPQGKAVTS